MIYEPTVVCGCDECYDTVDITPSFVYRDYSGSNGQYDCDDESIIEKAIEEHDWYYDEDSEKLFCENCKTNE